MFLQTILTSFKWICKVKSAFGWTNESWACDWNSKPCLNRRGERLLFCTILCFSLHQYLFTFHAVSTDRSLLKKNHLHSPLIGFDGRSYQHCVCRGRAQLGPTQPRGNLYTMFYFLNLWDMTSSLPWPAAGPGSVHIYGRIDIKMVCFSETKQLEWRW